MVTPLPRANQPVSEVGLFDARGSRVVAREQPGAFTALALTGTQLSWRDRGQARAARVVPR